MVSAVTLAIMVVVVAMVAVVGAPRGFTTLRGFGPAALHRGKRAHAPRETLLLVFVAVLLALAPSVEGSEVAERQTNAARFAQGMSPLPPVKRSRTEAAQRRKPSRRPHHGHHGHHNDHDDWQN